jgi:hypothetical protein
MSIGRKCYTHKAVVYLIEFEQFHNALSRMKSVITNE